MRPLRAVAVLGMVAGLSVGLARGPVAAAGFPPASGCTASADHPARLGRAGPTGEVVCPDVMNTVTFHLHRPEGSFAVWASQPNPLPAGSTVTFTASVPARERGVLFTVVRVGGPAAPPAPVASRRGRARDRIRFAHPGLYVVEVVYPPVGGHVPADGPSWSSYTADVN